MEKIIRYLRLQFFIKAEEDFATTYNEVVEGTDFKGYNLWILSVSILIASIGLITDSVAAIIGAMLISPLMGPVTGFAFGLAVNDLRLKKKSIQNWIWMNVVSLLSATIFFLIIPLNSNTNMLMSFEKATIFDVLLAFLGGMIGFVAIIRKDGTKIIAGVAVATSCMPPLCTASYGIAHLDWHFFLGGLYFYLINSLFIGVSTFLTAKYLGYKPQKPAESKISSFFWSIIMVLMIVPSIYLAYDRWHSHKEAFENKETELSDKAKIEVLEKKVAKLDSLLNVK